jgi:hypothetical protein
MAYSGSTASSTLANPPRLLVQGLSRAVGTTGLTTAPSAPNSQGGSLWYYCSTNLTTDVLASGFFSDGKALGMAPGDAVISVQFSSAGSSVQSMLGVITAITTAGAASMSTGGTMTSTFG